MNKIILGERIKKIRQDKKITQKELGEKTGLSTQVVSNIERGVTQPSAEDMSNIAQALNISIDALYAQKNNNVQHKQVTQTNIPNLLNLTKTNFSSFPVIGTIKAGHDGYIMNDYDGMITLSTDGLNVNNYNYIGLKVFGESMTGDGISEGDTALIELNDNYDNDNSIYAVVYDNELAALKRIKKDDEHIILMSSNPKIEPIILNKDDTFHIIGKLKRVIKKF